MEISHVKGYNLIKKEELKDIHAAGYVLRHEKSGARLVLIENDDENKVFSIGFRTPPSDSTGVPHILEHSVLCGSKKYPARDPFVELVKGSLNTFLNAMTYPDKTVYPVASCNDQDFKNLMSVYMDAVLYPNIYAHEEIFMQEGWSYELEMEEDELGYNGVVYNEMKGAFSSPESVLERVILNTLYPDTPYAHESGGDPEHIPELTYEAFLNFHQTFYHPSNSFIYLYGCMDFAERLAWLDREYLSRFEKKEIDSEIPLQKGFAEVRRVEIPYSIGSEESDKENTFLSYSRSIGTSLDPKLYLAFQILDYALLSAPGAPLMKTLTEAGIGKDIMGSYDNSIQQPIFTVTAKNADPGQEEEFLETIDSVLRGCVEKGIDKRAIEAGINYYEFRFREADFGGYPKGLMYGLQMLDSWLYDENAPFIHVEAMETFAFLRENITTGFFEKLIEDYLINNTHGVTVIVIPEKGRTSKMEEALRADLQEKKASLAGEEVRLLVERTHHLRAYQEEEDTREDLEKIPILKREDISRDIQPIVNEEMMLGDTKVIFHQVDTNGIGYMSLFFDLSGIGEEDLPYVGILQSVLGIIDTGHFAYGDLFNEINLYTGGIGTSLEVFNDMSAEDREEFRAVFEMAGKVLYPRMDKLFEMMGEILSGSKLEDTRRIREILEMSKSRLLMRFQSSGHSTAAMRALSYVSQSARFKDLTGGIDYYRVIASLLEDYDAHKDLLVEKLTTLSGKIFRPENMIMSYTSERKGMEKLEDGIGLLRASLEQRWGKTNSPSESAAVLHCRRKNEGFSTASKVQYVARAGHFLKKGFAYTGTLQILRVILSYDYLWQKIRVQGGAYGCMSQFTRVGNGYFVSYRDPRLRETNEVFEGIPEYLRNFHISDRDMTKYIIGTISSIDRPLTPAARGERSMNIYMARMKEEDLMQERREILEACQEDIRALAEMTEAILADELICVIGSEEMIEKEKEMFGELAKFQGSKRDFYGQGI